MISKDKKEAMVQILDTLKKGRAEAFSYEGITRTWVVTEVVDRPGQCLLPVRENKGSVGLMVGGSIWTTMSYQTAKRLADNLTAISKRNGGSVRLAAMEVADWSKARVAEFDKLIAGWESQAAEMGIK